MEKEVIMDSLKDLLNIRFDKYGDKTAFIEKTDNSREFKHISYKTIKEDGKNFFLFNNGITITCSNVTSDIKNSNKN